MILHKIPRTRNDSNRYQPRRSKHYSMPYIPHHSQHHSHDKRRKNTFVLCTNRSEFHVDKSAQIVEIWHEFGRTAGDDEGGEEGEEVRADAVGLAD